ncbi:MAG: putative protein-tyrosine phosphatase [Ilumatobacteraceae bacterium]|nr:putative protein-tyrosine phosphatase [Ilumatobacteraceae bacterium]
MGEPWPRGRSRHGGVDEVPLDVVTSVDVPGRLWLCGKHAVGPDPEALLAEIGADTVVCLTEAAELVDRYPAYVDWLRAHDGTRAIWLPIPDLHAPDVDALLAVLADVRGRLLAGGSLLVHCAAGIGRAGTVATCLLISMGVDPELAGEHVARHRPMAGPEAGAQRELVAAVASRMASGIS